MVNNQDLQHISLDDMMVQIKERLSGSYDLVVAVGRGGILPGYLAARFLEVPLETVVVRFRDETHMQIYPEPRVEKPLSVDVAGKRVLVTDDVSNSGATLRKAIELLEGAEVTTLVISGNADISLYGPHDRCICWPWEHAAGATGG